MFSIADVLANLDPNHRFSKEKHFFNVATARAKLEQNERHHNDKMSLEQWRLNSSINQADRHHSDKMGFEERKLNSSINQADRHHSDKMGFEERKLNISLGQTDKHHREKLEVKKAELEYKRQSDTAQAQAFIEAENIRSSTELAGKRLDLEHSLKLADRNHLLGQFAKSSELIDDLLRSEIKQAEDRNLAFVDTQRAVLIAQAETIKQQKLKELEHRQQIEKMTLDFNLRYIEMYLDNELKNSRLTFDKTCEVVFKLVERALGLGEQQLSREDLSSWVTEAMRQTEGRL